MTLPSIDGARPDIEFHECRKVGLRATPKYAFQHLHGHFSQPIRGDRSTPLCKLYHYRKGLCCVGRGLGIEAGAERQAEGRAFRSTNLYLRP